MMRSGHLECSTHFHDPGARPHERIANYGRQSPHPDRRHRRPARPRARKSLCRLRPHRGASIANPSISPMPRKPVRSFAAPQPEIILNAAAYTAVDRAETERDLAYAINEQAPRVLAEEALKRNALFVHYSTDYVFDGSKSELSLDRDRHAQSAQCLRRKQARRRTGGRKRRRQIPHLPHQLGLRPARQELSAHHASPGARARPALHRQRPDRRAHHVHRTRPRHARSIVTGILAGRFGAAQDWAGLYHMTCGGSVSWFGFAQAIFARAAELLAVKAASSHSPSPPRTIPPPPRAPATPSSPTPNCKPASASSFRRGNRRSKKPCRPSATPDKPLSPATSHK